MAMQPASKIDQKAYLKKYLSGDNRKKKKKERKHKSNGKVKIIDDDEKASTQLDIDEELLLTGEDAPQIVATYIEEADGKTRKWRSITIKDEEEEEEEERKNIHGRPSIDTDGDLWGPKTHSNRIKDEFSPNRNVVTVKAAYSTMEESTKKSSRVKTELTATQSPRQKTKGESIDRISHRGKRADSRDQSPLRRRAKNSPDLSPPRYKRKQLEKGKITSHEGRLYSPDHSPLRRIKTEPIDSNSSRRWKEDPCDQSSHDKGRRDSNDRGTVRRIKKEPSDRSPYRANSDQSPPQRRKRGNSSDQSPPRRRRKNSSDQSPPRRRKRGDSSDQSPPRRRRKNSSDQSPPRRRKRGDSSDQSPPRRKKTDQSPSRRRKRGDSSDQSPPRRRKTEKSPTRRRNRGDSPGQFRQCKSNQSPSHKRGLNISPTRIKQERFSPIPSAKRDGNPDHIGNRMPSSSITDRGRSASRSLSPPPTHKPKISKTMADGKRSGLQNADDLKKELLQRRRQEDELFAQMPHTLSGRNAEVQLRSMDRRGKGRVLKKELSAEEQKRKDEHEKKKKELYDRWNKGLKQIESHRAKLDEDLYESSKPLARYSNDEDLERHLREQERADDPMLEYMREIKKTAQKANNAPVVPVYQGPYPENRFSIRPGYRWDGVDRSNGYEKKWFAKQNEKKALQEEAFKYSVEDM